MISIGWLLLYYDFIFCGVIFSPKSKRGWCHCVLGIIIFALPHPRFVRRGRSSTAEDADLDVDSDYCETEDLRDFLDSPSKAPLWGIIQPGEKKIAKYLAPGTVTDLFTHYQATRQLFGAPSISWLGAS